MKRVILLISFLFAVVCFEPPPDLFPDTVTDDVGWVVQANETLYDIEIFAENLPGMFIVQEATYSYIGDLFLTDVTINEKYIIAFAGNIPNKQNSNYGYPFGANYLNSNAI